MLSACGVLCSACPAYHADAKGPAYQRRVSEAWARIYDLVEPPENIRCGGCLGTDTDLFHTSGRCAARRCCLANGFESCADCPERSCLDLERAQAVWDGVPGLRASLSTTDFHVYARPYCDHRRRLAQARSRHQ